MPVIAHARPYDADMTSPDTPPEGIVSLAQLEQEMGWVPGRARKLLYRAEVNRRNNQPKPGDLPEIAGRVGRSPYFWRRDIDQWKKDRPGQGAGGGRPWNK